MFSLFTSLGRVDPFREKLRCHSMAVLERYELESGGKIILPPSALDRLTKLHIDYPMLFCLTNAERKAQTHSGVLEFVAEEGLCYLPYWMMNRLLLEEGDYVSITSATLPKGQFVKLQPHTTTFTEISDPRAVLEMAFRAYSTLTVGDTIKVEYNSKTFLIDVLEVKPENVNNAITIVEADVQVDFAPPLDYVEPSPQFIAPVAPQEEVEDAPEIEEPQSLRFTGEYHTLRGGPPKRANLTKSDPLKPVRPPSQKKTTDEVVFQTRQPKRKQPSDSSGNPKKRRKRGEKIEESTNEPEKPAVIPFSGKAYSLK